MRWVFAVALVVIVLAFVLVALGVEDNPCPAGTHPAPIADDTVCRPSP